MKLAYKIPHRVVCRMVGGSFVAACTCNSWSKTANPRLAGLIPAFGVTQPDLIAEVIGAGHDHATGHVLEQSFAARVWARRHNQEAS